MDSRSLGVSGAVLIAIASALYFSDEADWQAAAPSSPVAAPILNEAPSVTESSPTAPVENAETAITTAQQNEHGRDARPDATEAPTPDIDAIYRSLYDAAPAARIAAMDNVAANIAAVQRRDDVLTRIDELTEDTDSDVADLAKTLLRELGQHRDTEQTVPATSAWEGMPDAPAIDETAASTEATPPPTTMDHAASLADQIPGDTN